MHRILVADDEPGIRHIIRLALEQIHVDVAEAGSGGEALERLKCVPLNGALVDLTLPDMNGIALTERMHQMDPAMPVILISASPELQSLAEQAHVSAVLEKPFKLQQLQDLVLEMLSRSAHPEETLP